ncbi:MAG: type VI secretion system accessory protein TagJ [Pseudophaeobacter sp. bin_em_oilr2.035]|jgi:type VI secretion system protein ImpE|uniref:Type VI secretion system accessory protein TagJ n=1 Tax=Phaeobacter gallaeciensis TaxID=60890 RepID=A0ABD4XC75_9RHOB|nr:type VI secretion system accessory protein TagJ [Phaeobacter gallaeciensis]MDF1773653.1 type VI secretion system accessory protein TagJ [Pseudophaeobacter sp. bin_em_oilr2.035]MEE2634161.1 type VI secretion system accessory protein TagJ [Pseudomonadota bacterium]MDE4062655.1 type VI secretion system accessory protein TagJ [Phaeobacter gallaeciensis]MDE4097177.1 type VI secretion system accessory protein TagJ [Phaeobacter gallaeciensis]MDE4106309.1 type VI secretion system accessory protein 
MTPEEYLKSGDPGKALTALQDKVRADPSNAKLRIFLFQLLCILGDWKRAIAQLKLSAELDPGATLMAQTYREAIICEVYREKVFQGEKAPMIFGEPQDWLAHLIEAQKLLAQGKHDESAALRAKAFDAAPATPGEADGKVFDWIADADMRLGPVLEVIINGRYFWMPFSQIRSLELDEPADLRDRVWMAGTITLVNGGELVALVPTRYPESTEADPEAMMARATDWQDIGANTYIGIGQRLLTIGDQDIAIMDLRSLRLHGAEDTDEPQGGLTDG